MKKIILFTRLHSNREWRSWLEITSQLPKDDYIIIQDDNVILQIYNGENVLGRFPYYDEKEALKEDPLNKAIDFIKRLYNLIKNVKEVETVVAIHGGGGATEYKDTVEKWLICLGDLGNKEAISLLKLFNKKDTPQLTFYSIGGVEKNYITNKLSNLEYFYHELRNEPRDTVLEAKLELLHACLTPNGAKDVISGKLPNSLEIKKEKFWDKKLIELNPNLFNEKAENINLYNKYKDWTVEEVVNALSGDKTTNKSIEYSSCFDEIYVNILSILRDSLLANYS